MGSSRKGKKKKSDDDEAVVTEGAAAQVKKCNAAMAMLYAPVERKEDPSEEFKRRWTRHSSSIATRSFKRIKDGSRICR